MVTVMGFGVVDMGPDEGFVPMDVTADRGFSPNCRTHWPVLGGQLLLRHGAR